MVTGAACGWAERIKMGEAVQYDGDRGNALRILADFYKLEKLKMTRYFYSRIKNRNLSDDESWRNAEDLTQDTFALAVRAIDDEKAHRIGPYIGVIARNRLKEFYRNDADFLDFFHNTRQREMPYIHSCENLEQLLRHYATRYTPRRVRRSLIDNLMGRSDGNIEGIIIGDEIFRLTLTTIKNLPEQYRNPMVLYFFEGYSYKQIAEMTGTRLSTVKSNIHRGMGELSVRLRQHLFPKKLT